MGTSVMASSATITLCHNALITLNPKLYSHVMTSNKSLQSVNLHARPIPLLTTQEIRNTLLHLTMFAELITSRPTSTNTELSLLPSPSTKTSQPTRAEST